MNKKNIIKYLSVSNILLVLFLLPFLVLFKLGGTYGEDGLWQGFYFFYYNFISIWIILKLVKHRNTKNIVRYRVWAGVLFLFITSHYITLSRYGIDAKYYLFPYTVWAPLTIIYLLTRRSKLCYVYIFVFLAIPLFFSLKSYIKEQYFLFTCEKQTPEIQYNPIYLSEKFFHITEDGLEANVIEVDGKYNDKGEWISYLDERLYKDYNNQILVFKNATCNNIERIKNILKNISAHNVILCKNSSVKDVFSDIRQFTTTLNLIENDENIPLVTGIRLGFAESPFWGSFIKKKKIIYCNYKDYNIKDNTFLQNIKENNLYNQFIKLKQNNENHRPKVLIK